MHSCLPIVDEDLLAAADGPGGPEAAGEAEPRARHEVEGHVRGVELVVRLCRGK